MTDLAEPVGKKLTKAREKRGLTIEEAGLETRIRPTQIAALEADDYSAFPSNTYARGFLLIYGKFLGVEVRDIARNLEGSNPISIEEYQYLNAYPEAEPERAAPTRQEPTSRRPSLAPLIVFVLLLGGAALGVHLYLQAQRLESSDTKTPAANVEAITPRPGTATTPSAAAPATTAIVRPAPTPPPFAAQRIGESDRAFLATPAPSAQPMPLPKINELVVEPLKKTWVRIRRDDPQAEPIFDDVLYPKVGALKLKGTRFFIEIQEADAVTLRKNGQAVAYQPPGITIQ